MNALVSGPFEKAGMPVPKNLPPSNQNSTFTSQSLGDVLPPVIGLNINHFHFLLHYVDKKNTSGKAAISLNPVPVYGL